MKKVTIYKLHDDGSQTVIAVCTLTGDIAKCEGNPIFVKTLEGEGIRDYMDENQNARLFPKDGPLFLEQLPMNFRSGYLMADVEE